MENNIYSPLDVLRKEIRLIDIHSSDSFEDVLTCTMSTVQLNHELRYNALSWCWGDITKKATLQLNGIEIQCPKNLEIALRYLRHATETITLWIDALSIKQDDLVEKEHQIPLMHEIYSQAEAVQIWLGEPADDSDEAICILKKLLAGGNMFGEVDGEFLTAEQFEQLHNLFQRPWWERTWTVQELVLAHRATFHCGHATFEFDAVPAWLRRVNTEYETIKDDFWEFHLGEDSEDDDDIDIVTVIRWSRRLARYEDLKMLVRLGSGPEPINAKSINAVRILNHISGLRATDPRDKVFGALGLLDGSYAETWKTISDWYTRSAEFVYASTTFMTINFNKDLFALCFIPERAQSDLDILSDWLLEIEERNPVAELKEATAILPSWAIDFSKESDGPDVEFLSSRFDCTVKPAASGEESFVLDYPFLILQGIQFDEVMSCHSVYTDFQKGDGWNQLDNIRPLHAKWRSFFDIQDQDSTKHRAYTGGGSITDAYWRTAVAGMCSDGDFNISRMTPATIKSYIKWLMQDGDDIIEFASDWSDSGNGSANLYEQSLRHWLHANFPGERKVHFFTTRRGYIGLSTGRTAIAEGDQIYLLAHSRVPFVLRSCSHSEKKVFNVISECYIDGIMDGEVMKDAPSPSSRKIRQNELRKKVFGGIASDPLLPLTKWEDVTLL